MQTTNKENARTNAKPGDRPPFGSSGSGLPPHMSKRGSQFASSSHIKSSAMRNLTRNPSSLMRGSGSNGSLQHQSISESGPELFGTEEEDEEDDDVFVALGSLDQLSAPMLSDPQDNKVFNTQARPRRQTTLGSEMTHQNHDRRMAGGYLLLQKRYARAWISFVR
jgi:hypothetical protein